MHPQFFYKLYSNTATRMAEKYAKGTVVDIGCGRMPYRERILARAGRYIGVDSPSTAKLYKGKVKPDIFADATRIPLPDRSADTVLLFQVLEHLPDPQAALTEIERILKNGGYLILSTIQSYPVHDEPHDFYRYTRYGLEHLVKKSGLKIVKQKPEGNVFVLIFQSFNVFLMLNLKKLTGSSMMLPLAVLLLPLVLVLCIVSNFFAAILSVFDTSSKFPVVHTLVAKK